MDWKHGYFAEGGYTYGHYPETTPSRLRWLALLRGMKAPESGFRYLDLGCGQGLSLILNAAQYPESEFVGVDFMPEHIAHARDLAARAGLTNVRFVEGDFLSLKQSPEQLGEFDYVIAHGITTWVSEAVRDALFELASGVLKPGGLMYNSYNTYPGWLPANPLQHLVIQLQSRYNGRQALEIARKGMAGLKKANSSLFRLLPNLVDRLKGMEKQDPAYLVQEYNNLYWQPVYCSEMLQLARGNKLGFVTSATIPESFDNCYPVELLTLMNTESDQILRETIRDLGVAQSFRRDIYVKGACKYWAAEQRSALLASAFIQTPFIPLPAVGERFKFSGAVVMEGDRDQYIRLLEAYGREGKTVGEVVSALSDWETGRVVLMTSMLLHGGWLASKAVGSGAMVRQLNRAIMQSVAAGAPYRYLGLGAAQAAMALGEPEIMMLALMERYPEERDQPALAKRLQANMMLLNRRFAEEGKAIEDPDQSLAKAKKLTASFFEKVLPLCQELKVI
jgi:SAM-dependent methyltransferase